MKGSFIIILTILSVLFASSEQFGEHIKVKSIYQHDASTNHPSTIVFVDAVKAPAVPEETREQCDSGKVNTFSLWDYSVVIGMLVISLGIGVFYGFFHQGSSDSAADFMLGSGMGLFPVTLSLTTSFVTAIELLGNPSEMFFNGTQFALIVVSMVLVIPVALKVFYPIYFKMQLTSCYEYLGMRFSKELRIFGGILYVIQMCFYTSVAVLAPAIALSKATGLNTRLAIVLIYIVCVFYSSQGGLKAVVIADTFQACVLFFSLIMILGLGTYYTGGVTEVFQTAQEHGRLELLNFDLNPTTRHTVWSVVIGGFFYWTSLFCVNQATVQKSMSLRKIGRARIALMFSICGLIIVFLVNFYTGLMTFTHYKNCDPLKSGQISAIDQLLPFYVMDVFKHRFVSGIFVAGIFAASLGTVASALSSLSAVTIEDLIVAGLNIKIPVHKGAIYSKWMSLGYGLFSFALIFIVERLGGILQATLTLNGLVGGVMLGLFSLGVFFRRANAKGALYGGLVALSLVICLGVVSQLKNVEQPFLESSVTGCDCLVNSTSTVPPLIEEEDGFLSNWYKISYMWYSCIGTLLTIFFGLLISMITESYNKRQITRITHMSSHDLPPVASSAHSIGSTLSRTKKISSFISNVAHDVNLQTIKIENRIRELSHVNLHHLNEDNEDRVNIIDEETVQSSKCMKKDTGNGKMFFIGFFEDIIHPEHHKAHDSDASDSEDGKEDGQSTPPIEKLHGEFNNLNIIDE